VRGALAPDPLAQGTPASGAELARVATPACPQGAMPGARPPGQHAATPTISQLGPQGPPAAVAAMAVGAGNEIGALPAAEVAVADVAGALSGADAAAMAAGPAAAMAAGHRPRRSPTHLDLPRHTSAVHFTPRSSAQPRPRRRPCCCLGRCCGGPGTRT